MATLLVYLRFLPLVLSAVTALENAIPLPGNGKAKLDIILAIITSAYQTEQDVAADLGKNFTLAKLTGIVTKIASAVVTGLNALGLFQSKNNAPIQVL